MVNKMPELGVPKLPTQTPTWKARALNSQQRLAQRVGRGPKVLQELSMGKKKLPRIGPELTSGQERGGGTSWHVLFDQH